VCRVGLPVPFVVTCGLVLFVRFFRRLGILSCWYSNLLIVPLRRRRDRTTIYLLCAMHVYFHHHLSDKRPSFFFTSIAYLLSNTKGNRRHLDQPCLGTLADVMRIACPACPTRALPAIYSTRLKRLHM
jgi:hypothetical protein